MKAPNTTPQIPSRDDPRDDHLPGLPPRLHPDRPTSLLQHRLPQDRVPPPPPPTRPGGHHPGRPAPPGFTVYECPGCGERQLGEQRCETCRTFTRRIGVGGPCPHCLLTELPDVS